MEVWQCALEKLVEMNTKLFNGVFAGRRVFITGHTGFKGSWLTHWLLELGADVTGFSLEPDTEPSIFEELGLSSRISHHIGDIRDIAKLEAAIKECQPEIILHLAAQPLVRLSYEDPLGTFETNVMGLANILQIARRTSSVKSFVVVTSDKCYNNLEIDHAYKEEDAMGGYDPYSASKGCAELVTASFRSSFFNEPNAMQLASCRAGNVIGGGDWALDRIIPDSVRALSKSELIAVRNPKAIRPWQHVLEPLAGYLWVAALQFQTAGKFNRPWNFGPTANGHLNVGEVVDQVVKTWGTGDWEAFSNPDAVHEAHFLKLDSSDAIEMLNWQPVWDSKSAISIAVNWYKNFYDGKSAFDLVAKDLASYVNAAKTAGAQWAQE